MSKYMTPVLVLAVAILAVALFIKGGEVITAYQVVQETNQSASTLNITNQAPTVDVDSIKCYDYNNAQITQAAPLYLRGGTTANVVCNATANDVNGGETINGTTSGSSLGSIYLSGQGSGCSAAYRKCYQNASCSMLGVKNATAQYVECSYYVYYHADNTSQASNWVGNITVGDAARFGSADTTFDVGELLAVGVPGILAFGTAQPGDVLKTNKSHAVTNYGNVEIDLKLNGSSVGMDCTSAQDIPVGNIDYNCDASQASFNGTNLTTGASSAGCTGFNHVKETEDTGAITETTKNTYWGVDVPIGVSGNCQGTIWFTAILS